MNLLKNITSPGRILFFLVLLAGIITLSYTKGPDQDYPRKPEAPGSAQAKWTESVTADGWIKVTNTGGATLG
jgi:hypothetical protein